MSGTPRFSYDRPEETTTDDASVGTSQALLTEDPKAQNIAEPFVARWQTLVSQTNWEKGRIICHWRRACQESELPSTAYSDEAWSQRAGGVTSQHVGRLRRVHERFGEAYKEFEGVHWSHFLAALDWDDAEMWLEGAARSRWSISQMRRMRWDALGGKPDEKPRDEDLVVGTMDEDYEPLTVAAVEVDPDFDDRGGSSGPLLEGPDFGDDGPEPRQDRADPDTLPRDEETSEAPLGSPFASLPALPSDIAEALEQFKLAIVRHRSGGWTEITAEQTLQVLDALKQFVQARGN
jgi:hypothetical protein